MQNPFQNAPTSPPHINAPVVDRKHPDTQNQGTSQQTSDTNAEQNHHAAFFRLPEKISYLFFLIFMSFYGIIVDSKIFFYQLSRSSLFLLERNSGMCYTIYKKIF